MRRVFGLVGCFGLVAGLVALVGIARPASAQPASIVTFTSAEIGASGQTPQFFEPGPWQMSWAYDCSSYGSEGNFIVDINGGSGLVFDEGPNELGLGGSGTDYYTDTGTFSLSIFSECAWSITVEPPPQYFHQLPGAARDVAIGADGAAWVVGTIYNGAGYGIYEWTGSAWAGAGGSAVAIAVDPNGNPWVINSNHQIYRRVGSGWLLMPGAATDIAIGADGAVWVVGTLHNGVGYGIYHWTGSAWAGAGGSALTIAVDPNGNPWVINSNHQIYRRVGSGWLLMPGAATDIAIGADGAVWVVGTNPTGVGYGVYHWTGSGWAGVGGSAVVIAVDPNGNPWIINGKTQIYVH